MDSWVPCDSVGVKNLYQSQSWASSNSSVFSSPFPLCNWGIIDNKSSKASSVGDCKISGSSSFSRKFSEFWRIDFWIREESSFWEVSENFEFSVIIWSDFELGWSDSDSFAWSVSKSLVGSDPIFSSIFDSSSASATSESEKFSSVSSFCEISTPDSIRSESSFWRMRDESESTWNSKFNIL